MIRKLTAAALAAAVLLSGSVTALAAAKTTTGTAVWRGISIVLDRETLTPADEQGNVLEPFIYNDTTYLPVRAVAGALGLGVSWDAETSTVVLTSGGETVRPEAEPVFSNRREAARLTYRDIQITLDGETLTPVDEQGSAVEPFIYNDSTYLPLRAVASALELEVGWDGATSTVFLGEQPEYETLLTAQTISSRAHDSVTTTTYTYDLRGHLATGEVVWEGSNREWITYTCDDAGRVLSEVYTNNYANEAGNKAGEAYSKSWTYTYDSRGNKLTETYDTYYTEPETITWTYDSRNNCTSRVEGSSTETWEYDDQDRVVRNVSRNTQSDTEYVYAYTYTEADGSLIRTSENGDQYVYEYDDAGNLTFEGVKPEGGDRWGTAYEYDAAGNLTREYSVPGGMRGDVNITYTYDSQGNLLTEDWDDGREPQTYTYTYTRLPVFR